MKKKVFIAAALMAMLGGAAMAQGTFTLKLGGGFPMGDFSEAKADYDNQTMRWGLRDKHTDGGAGLGFNVGFEYNIPVSSVNGLGVVISVDAFYNGINEELNDYFNDLKEDIDDYANSWSLSLPNYLNFPIMVGAKYDLPLTSGISLYAAGAAGVNIRMITPFELKYEEDYLNTTVERTNKLDYDMAATFGFRLAAGVTFAEKYSVELGYYSLGAGKVKGEQSWSTEYADAAYQDQDGDDKFTLKSITPSLFTVRFGISF
ncbi:MAG: outer membrane beta-barrel protein [Bacteroidales bacterium]|nr:outer membrane beta-barrel protein [Bacteroidales bacterium]